MENLIYFFESIYSIVLFIGQLAGSFLTGGFDFVKSWPVIVGLLILCWIVYELIVAPVIDVESYEEDN